MFGESKMRRVVLGWLTTLFIMLLSACGGGGGSAGDCVFCSGGDTGTSASVADLRIAFASDSATNISNLAPKDVTIVVTAVNSSNQVVGGASVVVTADSGVVTAAASSTSSSGTLSAAIGIGTDKTPRTIVVTAKSGSVSRTFSVPVVASVSGGAASMSVGLSSSTVTANSPATVTATVLDSSGQTVSNTVVSFSAVRGLATFSAKSALTNSLGQASVLMYPASNATSGADEVQASATVNGTAVTNTASFSVTPTAVSIDSFVADSSTTLSAYGQVGLTATLSGASSGTPVTVTIASVCVNKGKANITPLTQTTTNGSATFTYKDAQCGATETADTVTLSVSGSTVSKTLSIPLSKPTASSLGFVSSTPSTIYLKGSGYTEVSQVVFVVNDENGNPLPGQSVILSPTTTVGGLTMDSGTASVTKISDSNGQVSVRVNAGTVPTPVRIKAQMTTSDSTVISSVSSNLSVAVGKPSELNFSLSQKTINMEAMDRDGAPNTYTVIASDRMSNPVPAGTTINFVAEGGQVQSQGFTAMSNGLASATVTFQSASPRPADGRVTVLAYALGEESFLDANGNNIFDDGEQFQELGDVFLSRRLNAEYQTAWSDSYIAGTSSSACSATSSNLLLTRDASIPSRAATCDGVWSSSVYVRRAIETVFSTSSSRLMWPNSTPGGGSLDTGCSKVSLVSADDGTTAGLRTQDLYLISSGSIYELPVVGSLTFMVADANSMSSTALETYYPGESAKAAGRSSALLGRLNPMPSGTTISVKASDGLSVSVLGGSPIPNGSEATYAAISFKFDTATSGSISVTTTSPSGLSVTHSFNVYLAGTVTPVPAACSK